MGKLVDLQGREYGDLTVLSIGPVIKTGKYFKRSWLCRCKCGVEKNIKTDALVVARQISCGCKAGKRVHGHRRTNEHPHGTPSYHTWSAMRDRCHNPKHLAFERYGAKGVQVCDEWRKSFVKFLADMGERPEGMTLDRIDNSKGYFKENCRWATTTEQYQNKRVVRDKLGKFSKST